MRKPRRLGTDSGHKKDYLIRKERSRLTEEPGAIQTGGSAEERPIRPGARFGGGSDARGLRRRNVKRAQRKGLRRGERMEDHALAGGAFVERWRRR